MSNYVENLNDLIVAKKEIKSIIKDAGVEPGDVFSYYPAYIRAAIAGGGTIFDPDDYYTIDYIDENFVSYSYLAAALEDIDVDVVFSALPHGASMKLVPAFLETGSKVIDLSGDFRFKDMIYFE